MEVSRISCKSCNKKRVVRDEVTGFSVCESCGIEQGYDNLQASFGGINGPTGTFVRVGSSGPSSTGNYGDFNYKESKIYHAGKKIEEITSDLGFSSARTSEVRRMIEEITEGEFGTGNWFTVFIGACSYVVMRMNNMPISMAEIAKAIGYDLHELGRMVVRVVHFLTLDLPQFDIVSSLERAIQNCPSFNEVSDEKKDKMVKQGRFLLQCAIKWFLTTGRQPIPVVVAVLVFVAELNEVNVGIGDIAKELHGGLPTCKKRCKELKEALIKVAQVLPWGKDVTVKNIVNNAPFVIQYMEMMSRVKPSTKRKESDSFGFNLEELVGGCLMKDVEYGTTDHITEYDSQYFECKDRNEISSVDFGDLENFEISQDCLAKIYARFTNESALVSYTEESGEDHRTKRKKCGLDVDREWWTSKSDLSKKLSFEQIWEKDVGFDALPPSFIAGELACKRRREKIHAAKLRINEIMQPPKSNLRDNEVQKWLELVDTRTNKMQNVNMGDMDSEDFIIETLLLHQVREGDIEQGHYKRLLDLHVFDSETVCNRSGLRRKGKKKT